MFIEYFGGGCTLFIGTSSAIFLSKIGNITNIA